MATQHTERRARSRPAVHAGLGCENGPAAYVRANEPEIQACLDEGRATYDPAKRQQTYVQLPDHDVRHGLVGPHLDPALELPLQYAGQERAADVRDVLARRADVARIG